MKLEKNDLVILSSRVIPGNDRALGNIIDHLVRRGCRVMSGSAGSTELVHTSGHACQGEQRMMIDLVRPRSFVPIHGEYRMLAAHARTAEAAGVNPLACVIAEDGDAVELRKDEIVSSLAPVVDSEETEDAVSASDGDVDAESATLPEEPDEGLEDEPVDDADTD